MGKESDEILQRLNEIDDFLARVNDLYAFPASALELHEKSKQFIAQFCQLAYVELSEKLNSQCHNLEIYTLKLISEQLSKTAELYKINWTTRTYEDTTDAPLVLIKKMITDFEESVIKKNQHYCKKLLNHKQKLLKDNQNELCEAIDKKIGEIKEKPTRLLDVKDFEQFQVDNKPTQQRLKRITIIDQPLCLAEPLLAEITKLKDEFDELAKRNDVFLLAMKQFDHQFDKDCRLINWFKSYEEQNNKAGKLIVKLQAEFSRVINFSGYHEILHKELTKANSELRLINHQRDDLLKNILLRQQLINPATENLEELSAHLQKDRHHLRKVLKDFLDGFSKLNLRDNKDQETIAHINKLKAFIKELIKSLQAKPCIVDQAILNTLEPILLDHIRENSNWSLWKKEYKKLDAEKVKDLDEKLFYFTDKTKRDCKNIRKKISICHHTLALLEDLQFQEIMEYDALVEQNAIQIKTIEDNQASIQKNLDDFLAKLTKNLNVLPDAFNDEYSVILAKQTQEELIGIQNEFTQKIAEFKKNKEKLLPEESTREHLKKITLLQAPFLDELLGIKKKITLQAESVKQSLEYLRCIYTQEKEKLTEDLANVISDAKGAMAFEKKDGNEIAEKIAGQQKILEGILDSQLPLENITSDTQDAIATLNKSIEQVKKRLYGFIKPKINDCAQETLFSLSYLFSESNPFIAPLLVANDQSQASLLKLNEQFASLDETRGARLQEWSKNIEARWNECSDCNHHRNLLKMNADVFEERLKNKKYQTSLTILFTLEQEFLRIMHEYIDVGIAKAPINKQNQLKMLKASPSMFFQLVETQINPQAEAVLDSIDSRLFKLLSMHTEFTLINDRYINKNLDLMNDSQYFDSLKSTVEVQLRNDEMEKISDGKRWPWVQWIRINILKPLQHYDYPSNPADKLAHRFTATIGACRTEVALIEMGNDVYSKICTTPDIKSSCISAM